MTKYTIEEYANFIGMNTTNEYCKQDREIYQLRMALANMISLASPYFTDSSQQLAITEARAALSYSAQNPEINQ